MSDAEYADAFAAAVAARLTDPDAAPSPHAVGHGVHSLSHGAAGVALLHIERARIGAASWDPVRRWAAHLTATPISSGHGAFAGAPAVAHVLATAAHARPGLFGSALTTLDDRITTDVAARARLVDARIDRQEPGDVAEWDLISGLAGLTRYLLRRDPGGSAVREALTCLARVTRPLEHGELILPGWWTDRDPHHGYAEEWAGGHGNFGLAHGAAAVLAALAIAARHDVQVPGQPEAIATLCQWYQRWQQPSPAGPWWPQYITVDELHNGRLHQPQPGRPSWCYGTPGIARALQLAADAIADPAAARMAQHAVAAVLADTSPAAPVTDPSLCHGHAGLLHTMRHLGQPADRFAEGLLATLGPDPGAAADDLLAGDGPQLLEGVVGVALVLHSCAHDPQLSSPWDSCLLLG